MMRILFFVLLVSGTTLAQDKLTFKVDQVETARHPLIDTGSLLVFENTLKKPILVSPNSNDDRLVPIAKNGFLETIHLSYAQHRPLELSPDDVWLILCQGFSIHANKNIDVLKDQIFTDTKPSTIDIRNDSLINLRPEDWASSINALSDELRKHTKEDILDLMVPSFSTTTPTISLVYETTMLESVGKEVSYAMTSGCGIPSITLYGTIEDWEHIYKQVDKFNAFGMEDWVREIKPVLKQFLEARKGNPEFKFWKSIYKESQVYADTYISGWVLKFFPYMKKFEYFEDGYDYLKTFGYSENKCLKGKDYLLSQYTTDDFPPGYAKININWLNLFARKGRQENKLEIYAGFIGIRQNTETMSIRPEITWAICNAEDTLEDLHYLSPRPTIHHRYKTDEPWVTKSRKKPHILPIYNPSSNSSYQAGIKEIQRGLTALGIDSSGTTRIEFTVGWTGEVFNVYVQSELSDANNEMIQNYMLKLPKAFKPAKVESHMIRERYANTNMELIIRF